MGNVGGASCEEAQEKQVINMDEAEDGCFKSLSPVYDILS